MAEIYNLRDWIKDSDVDGRGILFQFTDSDIPILYDAIHQIVNREKKDLTLNEIAFLEVLIEIDDDSVEDNIYKRIDGLKEHLKELNKDEN